jgi:hypothetical protein
MKLVHVCFSVLLSSSIIASSATIASANPFLIWGTRILQGIGVYGTVTDGAEIVDPIFNTPKVGGNAILGSLAHEQFWYFCSNSGYNSYRNLGSSLVCSYEQYDPTNANYSGDNYSYDDVCNGYYSNSSTFDGQMCISNSVPPE